MLAARSRKAKTNSRGEASREQILAAAVELLREKGYAGLSISGICERADIAPTSLYWHFGNKAGLMEALLARIGGGHAKRISSSISAGRTPGQRLDLLVAEIRQLVTTQPMGSLTGVAIVGEGKHLRPELLDALRAVREDEIESIARAFEAEIPGSGEPLAIMTMACANYAALTWRMGRSIEEVDRILDGLRQTIVRMALAAP